MCKWRTQSYDLQLDALAIELYGPNFEVDSNSRDERRCPCIVTEAQQKTGLADTWQKDEWGIVMSEACGPESPMRSS
jgi:hypothetical protein